MDNLVIALDLQDHMLQSVEEEIRDLRINILKYKEKCSSILFTSTFAGEGKTTVSLYLARALGKCGKKVVWVDSDFHNPYKVYSIPEVLMNRNVNTEKLKNLGVKSKLYKKKKKQHNVECTRFLGVSDYLDNTCRMEEIVYSTQEEGLFVIPAGSKQNISSDALNKEVFNDFMAKLKEDYDYIIIDSSNVLDYTDSKVLTGKCDGTVYVIAYNKVRHTVVRKTIKELCSCHGNMLGAVLNRPPKHSSKLCKSRKRS